ncbi:hypothetical protein TYRP_008919 [Tyrophagus putrescentiae]|nr:hypothetical protein TYRP_008919 [Tyrophagus putrescentiae]
MLMVDLLAELVVADEGGGRHLRLVLGKLEAVAELGEVQQREAVGVVRVLVHRFGGVFRGSRRRRGGKDLHGKLDHLGRGGKASTTTVVVILAIVEAPAVLALFRSGKSVPSAAAAAARVIIVGRDQVAALRCAQTEGKVAEAAVDHVVNDGQLVRGGESLEEALLGTDVHRPGGVRPDQVDLPQGEAREEAGQQSLVHLVQPPLEALRVLLGAGTKLFLFFDDGLRRDIVQQSLNRGANKTKRRWCRVGIAIVVAVVVVDGYLATPRWSTTDGQCWWIGIGGSGGRGGSCRSTKADFRPLSKASAECD